MDFSTFLTHIGFKVVTNNIPRPTSVRYGLSLNRPDGELYELANDPGVLFLCHNASFEMAMWIYHMVPMGYPPLPIERWHDTMASAAMHSLPLGLDALCKALALPIQKDMQGHSLMLKMCKPDKDGGWSHHTPENLLREAEYNVTDVDSQYGVYLATLGLGEERKVWIADQKINQRGVLVDVPFVHACINVLDQVRIPMSARFKELTGLNATQRAKILDWVNDQGFVMNDMKKETLDAILDPDDNFDLDDWGQIAQAPMPKHVHEVLQLRRQLASSSVAKLERMLRCAAPDGRVRYTMQYHGANTGRWAGRLIQIQNYPRGEIQEHQGLTPEILADAIMTRDVNHIRELWGNDIFSAIISSLRSCIVPDRRAGNILVVGDYAQVEARLVLGFAGHHDRAYEMDATDAYAELAAMIFKRPINKNDNPKERQVGKNALLGCLSAATMVLTNKGWKAIVDVSTEDMLWDGKDWVTHEGLAFKGYRETLNLSGLRLTPEHLVFAGDQWFRSDGATKVLLSQALAFAMRHGPSTAMPTPKMGIWRAMSVAATVVLDLFSSLNITSITGSLRDAIFARKRKPLKLSERCFGYMQISAQIKSIVLDFLTEFRLFNRDAQRTLDRNWLNIIPEEGLVFSRNGNRREVAGAKVRLNQSGNSSNIFSRLKAGKTLNWKLIGSTMTGIMNRVISGSSPENKTWEIEEPSLICKPNLNTREPVYDLVNAGPRNRFCVLTCDGPLIVHNSGFGLGALGFQAKFAPNEPFELAELAIKTYRFDYGPLIPRFWYGLFEASQKAVWCTHARTYDFAGIEFRKEGDYLTMRLPSGRKIWYHKPERETSFNPANGQSYPSWSYLSYQGKKTRRHFMWYGQLMNNLVQGTARDLMVNAILLCEQQGLPVVFTAHDEVVAEILERPGIAQLLKEIMENIPAWARERRFNIKAETAVMERYRK